MKKKVSIDRVKLFIVINYRSLSAAGSSASRQSWKEGKRALLKPARASLFHVPRQRKSSSLALPAPVEKYTRARAHTDTAPSPSSAFSLPLSPDAREELLGASRGVHGAAVSRVDRWGINGSRWLIARERLWSRGWEIKTCARGKRNRKRNCAGELTFTHTCARTHAHTHTDARKTHVASLARAQLFGIWYPIQDILPANKLRDALQIKLRANMHRTHLE